METKLRSVVVYQTSFGKCPYIAWFNKINDKKAKRAVDARIGRLRLGSFGECSAVGGGISELKIDLGPGYRIYIGQSGQEVVVLLMGGDKSSQPTDLKIARTYWEDYKLRKQNEKRAEKK